MPFHDFPTLVAWLVESGGAGAASYALLAWLEKMGWFRNWNRALLRLIAVVQAIVLGVVAARIGGYLGFYPQPETALDWVNLAISVGIPAAMTHQLGHALFELSTKSEHTPALGGATD